MKLRIKALLKKLIELLPLKDIIVFESVPDVSGNTKAVFDELRRRGYGRRYQFVWWLNSSDESHYRSTREVRYVSNPRSKRWIRCFAKLFITENRYILKARKRGQYCLHIFHGTALKDVSNHYKMPSCIDEVISLSPYLLEQDAKNNGCSTSILRPMGFPRCDVLLDERQDLHRLFPDITFRKVILWMPTYRQHKNKQMVHSSISIPILHDETIAREINEYARSLGILILLRPHFAQDLSTFFSLNLSNILMISDAFLEEHGVTCHELLRDADALLSDYSSVYYDYLLTDRPIGLCWEDYEEYNSREGFIVDVNAIMQGGEKIMDKEDFIRFLDHISAGDDPLREERAAIRRLIYPVVKKCTGAITDRVEEILTDL